MIAKIVVVLFLLKVCYCTETSNVLECLLQAKNCTFPQDVSRDNGFCGCTLPYTPRANTDGRPLKLWCRTNSQLTFARDVIYNFTNALVVTINEEVEGLQLPIIVRNQNIFTIDKLKANHSYTLAVLTVKDDGTFVSLDEIEFSTLTDSLDFKPLTPHAANIIEWLPAGAHALYANISYTPTADHLCIYEFIYISGLYVKIVEVHKVEELYSIVLGPMFYNRSYSLEYTALLRVGYRVLESDKMIQEFITPTCKLLNNNSLEICTPEKLNINVTEEKKNDDESYDLTFVWEPSLPEPDKIFVELFVDYAPGASALRKMELAGNETSAIFKNVVIEKRYRVDVWATSPAGDGRKSSIVAVKKEDEPEPLGFTFNYTVLTITSTLVGIIILSILIIYIIIWKRRSHTQDTEVVWESRPKATYRKRVTENRKSQDQDLSDFNKAYEVERDEVILHEILGEGAFGIVRRGVIMKDGQSDEVAVKTLREKYSIEEEDQFLHEIKLLQTVGHHSNIVSLLGCVTACDVASMLLIVEYCALGDLQKYLHNEYTALMSQKLNCPVAIQTGHWTDPLTKGVVINMLYDVIQSEAKDCTKTFNKVSTTDLVSFALQVADGMEFLASNRIIHRDLAARNVLLTCDRIAKISDFGLSRDIYENNYYIKEKNGKVPLKWLAIESLLHRKYTTQSDVWSFGVLFWEIMTFASMPYDGFTTRRLIDFITKGGRLAQPNNTNEELYKIMTSCWRSNPSERPRFSDLKRTLKTYLSQCDVGSTHE